MCHGVPVSERLLKFCMVSEECPMSSSGFFASLMHLTHALNELP